VRAADGAAPLGNRGGENSKLRSLSGALDARPAADAPVRRVVKVEETAAVGKGKRRPPAGLARLSQSSLTLHRGRPRGREAGSGKSPGGGQRPLADERKAVAAPGSGREAGTRT